MTNSLKSLILAAAIAAFSGSAFAVDKLDVEKSIAAAKDAFTQANKVGGAWRDTTKMIKKAEKLMSEGKFEEADELAREAEAQSMLGYMQATEQTKDNLHI